MLTVVTAILTQNHAFGTDVAFHTLNGAHSTNTPTGHLFAVVATRAHLIARARYGRTAGGMWWSLAREERDEGMRLTNASLVSFRYLVKSPKAGFASIATQTSDTRLAVTLFGRRVTCEGIGAQTVALTHGRTARVLHALSGRLAVGTTPKGQKSETRERKRATNTRKCSLNTS